jgi:hypothetical protein
MASTIIPDWVPAAAWAGYVEMQNLLKKEYHYCSETGIFTKLTDGQKNKKGYVPKLMNRSGHLHVFFWNKTQLLHRLAWLYVYGWLPDQIDHIDGDKTNNKISNLRLATTSENQQNQFSAKSGNSSGYLGVSLHASGKWLAQTGSTNFRKDESVGEAFFMGVS